MRIKTAILGYGRSGSTLHADPIEQLDDFEMTAVCDIDADARKKASGRFACRVYEDYMEMIGKEELDLVVIVTRSDQHCKMTCDCLNAGVNVLVTKPWALNAGEANEMTTAAKKSGKLLLPWLPARWGCDLLRLKEIISSGAIGNVFQVRRGEYTFGIRHDWQTMRKYGGGYLLNWGPHLVDQPMHLLGKRAKSVYGQLKQVINPGDAEDVFYAVIKMEDGATVVSEFNICCEGLPNWIVQGDRGTVFVRDMDIEIHKAVFKSDSDALSYRAEPKFEVLREKLGGTNMITMSNRYGDPLVIYPSIAASLRGESPFDVTPESAFHLTEVLDAIRASDENNRVVHLVPSL